MVLSARVLNRTLLQRQHLLERVVADPLAITSHLVGLQAQDVLPPYLSLDARIAGFDPSVLSESLDRRMTVRLLLMRGTIHLVTVEDALLLRPFVAGLLRRQIRTASWGRAFPEERYDEVARRVRDVLADGPLSAQELGECLARHYPGRSASDMTNIAKNLVPLVQLPPRGLWRRSGGQRYLTLETWTGASLVEDDEAEVVRRYLAAFGPATAADLVTWSGRTGMRQVLDGLRDELIEHSDERGRTHHDLAGAAIVAEEVPAPVRLLGTYDNLWLSHAERGRVTTPESRRRWMGTSGGMANTVFVDGMLEGLWRRTEAGAVELELFRRLTREEAAELDDEVGRVERLLRK